MTRFVSIAVVLVICGLASRASAQVIDARRTAEKTHVVYAGFGLDAATRFEAGYVRGGFSLAGQPLALGLRLSLPSSPEGRDSEVVVLAQTAFLWGSWGVAPRLELGVRNADTEIAYLADVGLHLGATAGYFGRRFWLGSELGYEKSLGVYVSPSDRYRDQGYADARSGFYGSGGGILRAGLSSGVRLTAGSELTLRAGAVRSEELNVVDLVPVYGQLGVNVHF